MSNKKLMMEASRFRDSTEKRSCVITLVLTVVITVILIVVVNLVNA